MKNITTRRTIWQVALAVMLVLPVVAVPLGSRTVSAATGPCTAPTTDYGTVTNTVSATAAGTYRVWSRMSAPSTTANTYLLEIDGNTCYTVGGSTVPTYASGATTFFANDSTNWISKTSAGAQIDVSLTAGSHTFKLIGNAAGVVLDRLVMTQDTTCVPTGTGDNCANPPDITAPVVGITSPANNASISSTTTITANATDNVAVSKVDLYIDGTLKGTTTASSNNNYTYSINPATLSVGAHTLTAKAYDTSQNSSTSAAITITIPDTTPPTITGISPTSITQAGVTILWTTNEAADSQVAYGTSASYGATTTLNATKVTSHSVSLTGLTTGTTYHFQVKSSDAAGNLTTSSDATFTTLPAAGDTTKPTVSLSAPANNSTVAGSAVRVAATASDNVGVAGVQFKLDGVNLGAEVTVGSAGSYATTWNSTTATSGTHTLTAVARDAAGNTQTASNFTVTVNNTITYLPADINRDTHVNYLDLSVLATNYNKSGSAITNSRADINTDGIVNYLDLSALASKYGL